jgi:hypothetical protein
MIETLIPLALLLALAPGARAADDEAAQLQTVLQKSAPSIVTVQAVVKSEMKGGGSEKDNEFRVAMQGVVVDPTGLIMVSSLPLSPELLVQAMGGGEMPQGVDIKSTPTSIKVIVGNEDKEYDAFVAATDQPLGITFIKIEDLAGRTLTAVDLSGSAAPTVGQQVVAVSRLRKGYDYAPYFQTARISAEVTKPRKAWMLDGTVSAMGLPIFTTSGQALGVLSTVASGIKEEAAGDTMGFSMFMRMMGGGGGSPLNSFVVPALTLKPVIDQAKQQAATVAAERAKKKAATPPTPATPPSAKPAPPK